MGSRYIEPQASRLQRELVNGVEQIRIPMRRNWFVLLFTTFWITVWTLGGAMAIVQISMGFDPLLAIWLVGWLLGWLFAAATIATQIAGSEIIRVLAGDLETSVGVGRLRWRRLFRGGHIERLRSADPQSGHGPFQGHMVNPFQPRSGAIKFDYGARTYFAAVAAEEAEGRMIAAWLAPKLPRRATESA